MEKAIRPAKLQETAILQNPFELHFNKAMMVLYPVEKSKKQKENVAQKKLHILFARYVQF